MSLYDELRAVIANDLAPALFVPVTIRRTVPGTFDQIAGEYTADQTKTIACRGIAQDVSARSEGGFAKTRITLTAEALEGDTIQIGRAKFVVASVAVVTPDGNPILWEAEAAS